MSLEEWRKIFQNEIEGNSRFLRNTLEELIDYYKSTARRMFFSLMEEIGLYHLKRGGVDVSELIKYKSKNIKEMLEETQRKIAGSYLLIPRNDYKILQTRILLDEIKSFEQEESYDLLKLIDLTSRGTTFNDIQKGEDEFSYELLDGRRLSEKCLEIIPLFLKTISRMYEGKPVERNDKMKENWGRIVYLLADSQSQMPVVPLALQFEMGKGYEGEEYHPAEILLTYSPFDGIDKIAIYPLKGRALEELEKELLENSKNSQKLVCDITVMKSKVSCDKALEYTGKLLERILMKKTDITEAREYLFELNELLLGENSKLHEKWEKIKEKVLITIETCS